MKSRPRRPAVACFADRGAKATLGHMREALRRVGRYDLLEVIGRGGAAVVYLAHQRDLRRHVALKELAPDHVGDPNFAARFVEESRLGGAMSHPSIVTVHEYFEDDGTPYIAMEYLSRGSLRPYVGRLSIAQIAGVLESVLAGLSHGEARGVVHRDLKPENLLVAADGRVKIADFGVARAYNAAATREFVTTSGTTIGTPAYMAPEQALGDQLTSATDLYSLGIVAWEMLTGTVPFEQTDTPVSVLYRQVHEPVPPVQSIDPEVDDRLARWLDRMLAKAPQERFQSADSSWEELEDIVIDLLGPRWRREARLGSDPPEPDRHPLTPAEFEHGGHAPAVPETVTDDEPSATPPSGWTTILRRPRRHPADEQPVQAETPESRARPRAVVIIAVAAVVLVAAAAGAVIGANNGGGSATVKTNPPTVTQPAVSSSVDSKLAAVLGTLAVERAAGLRNVRDARTVGREALAADSIANAYGKAAREVGAVAGSPPALRASLSNLKSSYRALAAAVRAGSASHYRAAKARIASLERRLRSQAVAL